MNLKEKIKYKKKEDIYNKKITKSIKNNNIDSVIELLKQPYKSEFLIHESINYCLENNYYTLLDIILKNKENKNIELDKGAFSSALLCGNFESCDVYLKYHFKFKDVECKNVKIITLANFNRIFEVKNIETIQYFFKYIIDNYITLKEINEYETRYTKELRKITNDRLKIMEF